MPTFGAVSLCTPGPSGPSSEEEKAAGRPPATRQGPVSDMARVLMWAAHPWARLGSNLLAHCSKTAVDLMYAN